MDHRYIRDYLDVTYYEIYSTACSINMYAYLQTSTTRKGTSKVII